MKGDGIPLTPASILYYRVETYLPDYYQSREQPMLHCNITLGS